MNARVLRFLTTMLLVAACDAPRQRLPERGTSPTRDSAADDGREMLAAASAAPTVLPEVLLVNGESITLSEILEPLRPQLPVLARGTTPAGYRAELDKKLRAELINQVETRLIMQAASLDLGNDQIEEALNRAVDQAIKNRVNREFDGRVSRFEEELRRAGRSIGQIRADMRREIVVSTYLKETILPKLSRPTRQELWDYYQEHLAEFTQQESRELLLIDIRFDNSRDNAHQVAKGAMARLEQGEAFEALARDVSLGVHREDGGAWGRITSRMRGRYEPVSDALFELDAGQVSGLIEGSDAFFIVKVGEVLDAQRTAFKDIQPQLNERYRAVQFERQRRRTLQGLLQKAVIEPDAEQFRQALLAAAPSHSAALNSPVVENAGPQGRSQAAQQAP